MSQIKRPARARSVTTTTTTEWRPLLLFLLLCLFPPPPPPPPPLLLSGYMHRFDAEYSSAHSISRRYGISATLLATERITAQADEDCQEEKKRIGRRENAREPRLGQWVEQQNQQQQQPIRWLFIGKWSRLSSDSLVSGSLPCLYGNKVCTVCTDIEGNSQPLTLPFVSFSTLSAAHCRHVSSLAGKIYGKGFGAKAVGVICQTHTALIYSFYRIAFY